MTSSSSSSSSAWRHIDDAECRRFTASVELVGKRWSSGILLAIAQGATRFSEIVDSVVGLSDRLLAQRLKELERVGLVSRSVVATTPVQVRYALTPRGADLLQSLQPLVSWGQRWGTEAPTPTAAPQPVRPPSAAPTLG
ncbi:winged helix-turn-helix transcriptional regulator [Herbiconiux sp. P16]|uniref:winged helix-turn-helix transcriptional regulator n=1 Tax=Herbiconiux wuyangfengii TaxID=3342794 RepID=UPI0035BB279E